MSFQQAYDRAQPAISVPMPPIVECNTQPLRPASERQSLPHTCLLSYQFTQSVSVKFLQPKEPVVRGTLHCWCRRFAEIPKQVSVHNKFDWHLSLCWSYSVLMYHSFVHLLSWQDRGKHRQASRVTQHNRSRIILALLSYSLVSTWI